MTEKIKIQEVLVVEGKDDTENLRRFYDVDTYEPAGQLSMMTTLNVSKN